MDGPSYTPLTKKLPSTVPFVGPETQERRMGAPFRARIGANESVFGPSPRVMTVLREAAAGVWMYGDPESWDLKRALATHLDVPAENIVVGEGIDALLGYLVRLLVTDDVPVVSSLGAYPTFNYHVAGYGGRLLTAPYANDTEDPHALVALARRESARLIYFANPDNPMGTWHRAEQVAALIDAVPEGCLLCLDEAYLEFAPADTAPPLDIDDTRVIRFRTFSKAYGMAGARIGYGIAQADLIRAFDKVRNHFGVNRIAQAGALAALRDQEYLMEITEKVALGRERIGEIARANGLSAIPSATNFVAVDCGGDELLAEAVLKGLAMRGIFVRMPQVRPQNRCIRVSVGTEGDLDMLEQELPKALEGASERVKD